MPDTAPAEPLTGSTVGSGEPVHLLGDDEVEALEAEEQAKKAKRKKKAKPYRGEL